MQAVDQLSYIDARSSKQFHLLSLSQLTSPFMSPKPMYMPFIHLKADEADFNEENLIRQQPADKRQAEIINSILVYLNAQLHLFKTVSAINNIDFARQLLL